MTAYLQIARERCSKAAARGRIHGRDGSHFYRATTEPRVMFGFLSQQMTEHARCRNGRADPTRDAEFIRAIRITS
jgi:hypothetical protein